MTNNHLLLYHLAELMLEREQHTLPVDDLFEDEQIGGFVRSINIDSPYQQSLFEGVLTETIKKGQVLVYFTVEGYFHYVLGEVVYKKALGKEPEFLKNIIENNQLKGAIEGVKECLIRDVQKNRFDRLTCLVDFGGKALDACVVPFCKALTLNMVKGEITYLIGSKVKVEWLTHLLFKTFTFYDMILLDNVITVLYRSDKRHIGDEVLKRIARIIAPLDWPNWFPARMIVLMCQGLKKANRDEMDVDLIPKWIDKSYRFLLERNWDAIEIVTIKFELLEVQAGLKYPYHQIIDGYIECLDDLYKSDNLKTTIAASVQNSIGYFYDKIGEVNNSVKFYKKALQTRLELHPQENHHIANIYNNLGVVYMDHNPDLALKYLKKALTIEENILGEFSPNTAMTMINLSKVYRDLEQFTKAVEICSKACSILNNFNSHDEELNIGNKALADIYFQWGKRLYFKDKFKEAIEYLLLSTNISQTSNNTLLLRAAYTQIRKPKLAVRALIMHLEVLKKQKQIITFYSIT